jgi:hypothetical protein
MEGRATEIFGEDLLVCARRLLGRGTLGERHRGLEGFQLRIISFFPYCHRSFTMTTAAASSTLPELN